ncbi:MAG: aminopeptidase P family protein [Solobacterium sp.]|nr:aminopeptidase P family protein [Solobacterium sp.]
MEVKERIARLRALMKAKNIDVYYIPNGDDHLSDEYTADYFKCKSWMSGFSGESGCTIVTEKFAGLWTDGRYFTQAEDELKGTGVELMRMRQEGVPDPLDFLVSETPENGVLGFDGKVVSVSAAKHLAKQLAEKNAVIKMDEDLAGMVWGDERPPMPKEKIFVLAKKYTGESAEERIARVREEMKKNGADVLILTALEDPCWMLNIRGNDIECTPVVYAFAMVTMRKVYYYADAVKITPKTGKYLADAGVTVKPYNGLEKDLKKLKNKTIWANLRQLNAYLESLIDASNTIKNAPSPVGMFRAVKNKTEMKCLRNAHVKDGVAMVRFIKWVKENIGKIPMSEISAEDHLYELRAEGKDYIEPSFPTISAYKGNAAMMHYSASPETNAQLSPEGFLLVDSGGTYKDGTTDITRTIALGPLSDDEKRYYTLVLKGHLALANARFLYGTTGQNLDILARGPLWNIDIDYQCGTGHGVGHVLSVHEGPQSVGWGFTRMRPAVKLEEGMIVTDEPGVYLPRELGVRIENELLVRKGTKNFYGQFMYFENVTYCPYEPDAIDVSLLNEDEIRQINEYHSAVYDILSPYLDAQDQEWLKKETRRIGK